MNDVPLNALAYSTWRAPPPPTEDKLGLAVWYALSIVRPWVKDGQAYIPYIDPTMKAVTQRFKPVREIVGNAPPAEAKFVGYEVDDTTLEGWAKLFASSPRAASYIRNAITSNLLFNRTLPPGLLVFSCHLVEGAVREAEGRRHRPPETHRNTLLLGTARKVSSVFSIELGAASVTYQKSDEAPIRGCTIAAAALYGVGVTRIAPKTADDICRKINSLPVEEAEAGGVFHVAPLPSPGLLGVAKALQSTDPVYDAQWHRAMAYFK